MTAACLWTPDVCWHQASRTPPSAGRTSPPAVVPDRHLPVRPNLDQLRQQARDLLRDVRRGDSTAVAELQKHHPGAIEPDAARLAHTQLALARSYGLTGWWRLVLACRMTDAIWRDDVNAVRTLIVNHPRLLHEDARGVRGNWGPPMSYAANLGRDRIIEMLHGLGATDLQHAFDRACLQGQIDVARRLHGLGARPFPGSVMGSCETQNAEGLAYLLELGADLTDEHGDRLAPIALILQTYSRNARGKHECLELVATHGIVLPDTPPIAVHRGRTDLLERHLQHDPQLPTRTFAHEEIIRRSSGVPRTTRWRCTARRSRVPRCCTCAWTSTKSISRDG